MQGKRIDVLAYAVRIPVVVKYCGQLGLMLGLLTLAPLAVALLNTEWVLVVRYGILCGGLFLLGGLLARLSVPARIQANEALTVTALTFLLASLLMSWPMMGPGSTYIDALFEAVSGVTTTGLSTLGSLEGRSHTFLFARAWMQWYGGLGIIVLSVALFMGHHAVARRLTDPVENGETLLTSARTYAQHSLFVYGALTLLAWVAIWTLSGEGFTALLHVLSAVSTGGFSNYDASLAGMSSHTVAIAVMTVSLLGAVSLPLYWRVVHAGWRRGLQTLLKDVELRALVLACLLIGSVLSWLAWRHGAAEPWYQGMMMGVSAQTTTGFATQAVSDMDPASKVVMIISMLIGGSVGSSAGGVKILRLLILLRLLQLMLRRTVLPPHAVIEPALSGQRLEADDMIRAMQVILLFVIITVLSWLPFVAMGYDPLDALFEVVSATGTVGLSSGIARPELETFLKGVLCFDMLAGRVEIIALLVILYPRNWIGRREEIQ